MILNVKDLAWTTIDTVDLNSEESINRVYLDVIHERRRLAPLLRCENAIEERNKLNLIEFCDMYIAGDWQGLQDKYNPILNDVKKDMYREFHHDNTVFAYDAERTDYLIINFISMGDMESRYMFPKTNFRPHAPDQMDIPVIHVSEHGNRFPYWLYPDNHVTGNGAATRAELKQTITELAHRYSKLKKVFVLGDCRNACGAHSWANELDFVTHSLILNGQVHWKRDLCPPRVIEKDASTLELFMYIKAHWFEHVLKLDDRLIDPYKYTRPDLTAHYWWAKYDTEWHHNLHHVEKYIPYSNRHEIDYKFGENVHYVMPHWDRKILRSFIENEISK